MSATPVAHPATMDPQVAGLEQILAELGAKVLDGEPMTTAERIDRIAILERIRSAAAAFQVAEVVRFGEQQVAEQQAQEMDPRRIGAGIADLGMRAAANCVQRHAYEADRQGYVDRSKTSAKQRRVTLRPGRTA